MPASVLAGASSRRIRTRRPASTRGGGSAYRVNHSLTPYERSSQTPQSAVSPRCETVVRHTSSLCARSSTANQLFTSTSAIVPRLLKAFVTAATSTVLIDHYEDDWSRLKAVLLCCRAEVVKRAEQDRAWEMIREKFPQHATVSWEPRLTLGLRIHDWRQWGVID